MTLKEIKSMFKVGDVVLVTREGNTPITIVGNLGNTVMPANNGSEPRTVKAARSGDWVLTKADGRDVYTSHPKASEVLESGFDFVKFRYASGTIVTIKKDHAETHTMRHESHNDPACPICSERAAEDRNT